MNMFTKAFEKIKDKIKAIKIKKSVDEYKKFREAGKKLGKK